MKNRYRLPVLAVVLPAVLCGCDPDGGQRRMVGLMESDRVEITAEFAEPIVERLVREGEAVHKGQLLISQDKARIDARIAEADAQLGQAQARLDELIRGPRKERIVALRASVSGARSALELREIEYARAQEIYDRDLASSELRDRTEAARDDARANLERLEAELDELLTGTTPEELRQAEAAVRQAEATRLALGVDRERHDALAPQSGVIDSLLLEVGEHPSAGQPMAVLLAGEQAYARVFVPAALRAQTVPGVNARIWLEGASSPLAGVVRWVSSEAAFTPYFALTEEDRGRLSFVAKIDVVDATERIPDGVPVEVELDPPGLQR